MLQAVIDKMVWPESPTATVEFQKNRDAADCNSCSKAFGSIRRRHHCRLCGLVFCGPCSPHRVTRGASGQVFKDEQRSCSRCFVSLREALAALAAAEVAKDAAAAAAAARLIEPSAESDSGSGSSTSEDDEAEPQLLYSYWGGVRGRNHPVQVILATGGTAMLRTVSSCLRSMPCHWKSGVHDSLANGCRSSWPTPAGCTGSTSSRTCPPLARWSGRASTAGGRPLPLGDSSQPCTVRRHHHHQPPPPKHGNP